MTIYPNPASDNVTITINDDPSLVATDVTELTNVNKSNSIGVDPVTYSIKIYNSQSALLSTATRSGKRFNIPLVSMRDGTYIIEVSDGKNNYSQQLIVKHN